MNNLPHINQPRQTNTNNNHLYKPTGPGQWTLTVGTIVYNFDTGEEDIIVDYENGRSAITAKGRAFHCSASALGGGWKAVRKIYP